MNTPPAPIRCLCDSAHGSPIAPEDGQCADCRREAAAAALLPRQPLPRMRRLHPDDYSPI